MTPSTVALGPGGPVTTRLGFGCSGITGGLGRRQSLHLLQAAYDAGIRHYDVAPMYGFGTAQDVVGEFARRHPGTLTLTSKYGIVPPPSGGMLSALRAVIRPVANRFPPLRQALIRRAGSVAHATSRASFTPSDVAASLEHTLRQLRVDHLDLFLLHDAEAADLAHDGLQRVLEDAQRAGKFTSFGVGSPSSTIDTLVHTHPEFCHVVQHEWSALTTAPLSPLRFHILHRTIAGALPRVSQFLQHNPSLLPSWTEQAGVDLAQPGMLAALLLKGSLHHPGVVLFSSREPARIRQNAATAADRALAEPASRLYQLIRTHCLPTP